MADDFSDQLSAVLNNPDAMGQIMSIAQSLTGGDTRESPSESDSTALPAPSAASPPDLSGLLGLLGGLTGGGGDFLANLDPRILQSGMRILTEFSRGDDRKTALLLALKPFLKEERAEKIDRAIQIAKLSRLVRPALQIFREGGEPPDV